MIDFIDLSGEWSLELDEKMEGKELPFSDSITLPNSTSNAGKGRYNENRETGFLTDTYKFEGWAWFSKEVDFSRAVGKNAFIFFERTRISTLFIDGKEIGSFDSLVSPHIYDITDHISEGIHTVTVKVSNIGYKTGGGHLTSADTQTNWNGIVGRMELQIFDKTYVKNVFAESDIKSKTFHIKADVVGESCGKVRISAVGFDGPKAKNNQVISPCEYDYENGKIDVIYEMGEDAYLWDEYRPYLYNLSISIGDDTFSTIVGLRDFKTDGDKFTINGKKTFLRGKHDGMIFPKTGFMPTDVAGWLRVMSISQDYGMNHYRYHTCCPPEAAFMAADMLGIYMEPELPFWGTIAGKNEEEYNESEQEFLIEEGFRMMNMFGNHPSYCMMSLGNELWGSTERLNEIIGGFKAVDTRHLYTQGSNNFQFFPSVLENDDFFCGVRLSGDRLIRGSYAMCDAPLGHVQTRKPATDMCYDSLIHPSVSKGENKSSADGTVQIQYGTTMKTVKASEADASFIPKVPIVTHEIGQYETYPDFNEIKKYTGSLKAKNFEVFKERLEKAGMGHLAKDFFKASGKLAVACYKEEMEAVFRSRLLGGFQILDIQDFSGQGTALVGVLDAFMDEKGTCSPKEWKKFCSDAVLLGRFNSYTYESGDTFNAHIEIAYYRNYSIDSKTLTWELKCSCGSVIAMGNEIIHQADGQNYIDICDIDVSLPEVDCVRTVELILKVDGTDIENSYKLWVFPKIESVDISGAYLFESTDSSEAKKLLSEGKTILIVPDLERLSENNFIKGFYCQDFWCYPMFRSISESMNKPIPVGTMGLLIDNSHPALSQFPCEVFSTEQWWEIVENSKSEILDNCYKDKNIIVRTIDNFERNHQLGMLYEYEQDGGKVVVCNCDFDKLSQSAAGKQFIKSVIDYCRE